MPADISVIVPLYNRAKYVPGILAQCQAQSLQPREVIFVDDCSSDDAAAAIAAAAGGGIDVRLVRHPVNRGVSAARNTGVREARGTYVAFLDSDDGWLPQKLERQYDTIQAQPEPTNTVCLTRTNVVTGSDQVAVKPERLKPETERWGDFIFVHRGFAQTSSFFLARSLALASPFNEKLRQYEDYNFLLDLEARGARSVFVPDVLTIWHDEGRADRLSSRDDVTRGDLFLATAEHRLSAKARAAFTARYLAPQIWRASPAKAVQAILRAMRAGAVSPAGAVKILMRCLLSPDQHDRLKQALARPRAAEGPQS